MNIAMRLLVFGLCVNLSVAMISGILDVSPALTTVDIEQLGDAYNASKIVGAWNWGGTGSLVGDIGSGLRFFWNINVPIIEGLIILAESMGCPLVVLTPIKIIWRFIWFIFVIDFISGRRLFYD